MAENSVISQSLKNKYKKEIQFVRNANLKLSDHALKRIAERKIRNRDVYKAVEKGVLIEVHDKDIHLPNKDIKFLFQDAVEKPPYFLVDVAVKEFFALAVTAYLPDTNIWYVDNNFILRRI